VRVNGWDIAWLAITAGGLTAFGVAEGLALRERSQGKGGGTYSAALRRWFGIEPAKWWRWIAGPIFGLGLAIFGVHILMPWM
jgi:hypothetical protein